MKTEEIQGLRLNEKMQTVELKAERLVALPIRLETGRCGGHDEGGARVDIDLDVRIDLGGGRCG